eukprot:GHRR01027316.1.p1 GENE.GHRR01027316.1~~GHRR01027316.1.p1  ORF type:complete len:281 (+),score=68.95 GHRR01027316.1:280-1122(+)
MTAHASTSRAAARHASGVRYGDIALGAYLAQQHATIWVGTTTAFHCWSAARNASWAVLQQTWCTPCGVNFAGGPHLEQLANSAAAQDKARYKGKLQLPLRHDKTSCNFSFSGLKTSVAKLVESERARLQEEGAEENQVSRVNAAIASVFQEVSVRFLEERTERALLRCQQDAVEAGQPMPTCLVIAGGVAANAKVRSALQAIAARFNLPCLVPPPKFCSDNGLMVAWTGIERLKLGLCRAPPPTVEAVESAIEVLPRWPLGPVDVRGMTKQNAKHCKLLH